MRCFEIDLEVRADVFTYSFDVAGSTTEFDYVRKMGGAGQPLGYGDAPRAGPGLISVP